MSRRQPTIKINDQVIAHDEIVGVIDLKPALSADNKKTSAAGAIKLVDGTILPLPPDKLDRVINFLYQNER
jgi:hypothetical protein